MSTTPLVSICCVTYNHAQYIRQCLDGFVMQKTNFPIEVLINDDASTDGTADIIREYEQKYPEIIKPVYQTENQYSKGINIFSTFVFPRVQGKYIALCEGDDYWTDPLKLQKQIDFLEENEDFSICFHPVNVFDQKNNKIIPNTTVREVPSESDINLLAEGNYINTCSVMYRTNQQALENYKKRPKLPVGDYFLHMFFAEYGKIKKLPNNMAVYRIHDGGTWSLKPDDYTLSNSIKVLEALMLHFEKKIEIYTKLKNKYKYDISYLFHFYYINNNIYKVKELFKYLHDYSFEICFDCFYFFIEKNNILSEDYNNILTSRSYRITKPLRIISSFLKKIKKRLLNILFIISFLAIIVFPLIFIDLKSDRKSSLENRMLANRPDFSDIIKKPETFRKQFDAWFKDSTGFRRYLIKINNIIDKNIWLNGVRYKDGQVIYLVGEHGHHYFADIDNFWITKYQGKLEIPDDQLINISSKIENVKTYLQNKGIPLILMFCTEKETIYPEFYPKSIIKGPEPTQLETITNYLQENTSVDIFNIKEALFAEKYNYLLYPVAKGDLAHYTEIGGFFAYRELIKHITPHFPNIIPYTLDDITINLDNKENPKVSLNTDITYKKLDSTFFDDVPLLRPFSWENHAYENTLQNQSVILVLCDSFSMEQYIGKYLAQHFGKAIFIHNSNIQHLDKYIERYEPDIVLFESLLYLPSVFLPIPDLY
jgi:glycosyltransferase involved in cell wall biosynthesis